MSTVSQRRTRRRGSFQSQREALYQPKKRRWLKRLVIGTTLLAILVLVAPTIISNTPLRNAPLRLALNGIHGSVQAGAASLSWFSPISYSDIEIRDSQGNLLLSLPKIESQKSLFELITHLDNLGKFRIDRPQISLVLRRDGSNAEDVFNPLLASPTPKPESKEPTRLPTMTLEIVDGKIELHDASARQHWQLDKFNLLVRTAAESPLPVELKLSGQVPYENRTAKLTLESVSDPATAGSTTAAMNEVHGEIDALPLAMFRALADRFAPGLQIAGTLSTNIQCRGLADLQKSPLAVEGKIALDATSFTGGPLGSDRFALNRVELPCKFTCHDRQLDIEQLGLNCDVGQISAKGTVALPAQTDASLFTELARSSFNVDGQLDLVKLAALLPSTLRLREGTQITSGQVRLAVASKPDAAGQNWTAQLTASDVAAIHEGRRFGLDQPVSLQLSAHQQAGNYWLGQLNGTASFLTLSARGSLDQFQAEAQCDLDRLMGELNQFVDLGEVRLAGRADSRFNWQRATGGAFQASTEARLQSLQISLPGRPAWQEDSAVISAAAAGVIDNLAIGGAAPALRRLDSAQLSATVDNAAARTHEELIVRLLQPIDQIAGARWPVETRLQGQIGHWWPRIASWLQLNDLDLAGACDLTAQANCTASSIELQQLKGAINNLHAWGFNSIFIDEPVVQLDCAGAYEFATGRLNLNRTSLLTSTLSLHTDAATATLPGPLPFSVQGIVSYQADVGRLLRWISDPRTPPNYALTGRLIGSANLSRSASATAAKIDAAIDDFAAYTFDTAAAARRPGAQRTPQTAWTESKITLALDCGWNQAADAIQLTSLQVGAQALRLQTAGRIDALSTRQNLDLSGTIDYDWQTLAPLLKPYLGSRVAINGHQSRRFSVRGPMGVAPNAAAVAIQTSPLRPVSAQTPASDSLAFVRPLVGDLALGWSSANLYGLTLGQLDLDMHLEGGTINVKPIDTSIGDPRRPGRLTIAPTIQLSPSPSQFMLSKGPLLTNAQITPELSNTWVKFVAPVLAECTQAEGLVSVDLDTARIPLDDPAKGDIGGHLTVQSVSITPGPMARPLVSICEQIDAIINRRPPVLDFSSNPTLLKIDNQKVDFRMVDGRIYHQGLSMQVGEVAIRTRGWVGIDESLGLVAEIPLQPEWTQRTPALANIPDQTLKIPIGGTLSQPKVDSRVVEQLIGSAVQNTVRGTVEKELNKTLDRFLPPSK
jgi:hypothetical protein